MPSHELTAVSVCASAFQIQQGGLPLRAGVGLKPEYFRTIVDTWPDLGFFEIHAENYMVAGGPFHHYLTTIRERYPLSIHSVGLSIGGEQAPDPEHLRRLRNLLDRYQPEAFSEHLAWSNNGQLFLNDLLPVPYCVLTLTRICNHIDQIQTQLGRRMLLENPATYVEFAASTFEEPDFICEVIRRTGCGLLLDVNNIYVSCFNHHRHATGYLRALPLHATGEIHLAGFARDVDPIGDCLLIDSHDCPVAPAVWQLYDQALELTGPQPSLLERDNDLPAFEVLLEESQQAERRLTRAATAEKPIQ